MSKNKTYYALNERHLVKPEMEEPKPPFCDERGQYEREMKEWNAHLESLPPIEIEGPDIVPRTWYGKDEWTLIVQWQRRDGEWIELDESKPFNIYTKIRTVAIPVTPVQQGEEEEETDSDYLKERIEQLELLLEKKTESSSMWARKVMEQGTHRVALQNEIERLKKENAEGWISIEVSLPDYDQRVLWYLEDGNMVVEELDKDGNPWLLGKDLDVSGNEWGPHPTATHWRGLPKGPNSEQNAEVSDTTGDDSSNDAGK